MSDLHPHHMANVRFCFLTPDGSANIIIAESAPGKIEHIFYLIGKSGTSLSAWTYALAEFVAAYIKLTDIDSALVLLKDITSDRFSSIDGVDCRSGPEALYIALTRYKHTSASSSSGFKPSKFSA